MIISRGRVARLSDVSLLRFVNRVRRVIKLHGGVDVLITTSGEMKRLNDKFRGQNEPTDVLSFPCDGIKGSAGEIAISLEIARQNAGALGHSTADEIKILVLHGMLHLAGYDHERDHGQMARKETHFREMLKLPSGLIERAQVKSSTRPTPKSRPQSRSEK